MPWALLGYKQMGATAHMQRAHLLCNQNWLQAMLWCKLLVPGP